MNAETKPVPGFRYVPERIWKARRLFFGEGRLPQESQIDQALLRSWNRCGDLGRSVDEQVVFEAVEPKALANLLQQRRALLDAAQPALTDLASAVSTAGYAVLLTDAHGCALAVAGDIGQRSRPLREAFRPGVDLSEAVTGTTAMALALAEHRASWVMGPEHYFADNQIFHCCAAPVFDARGHIMAAVDISRDTPGLAASAMNLTLRCAQRIERSLFEREPAFVRITLEADEALQDCSLAFDQDGRWLATSREACRLLGRPHVAEELRFEDLFADRFSSIVSALRRSKADLHVHLQDGVRVRVSKHQCPGAVHPLCALKVVDTAGPASSSAEDPVLRASLERARRAFDAGLPVLVTGETGVGKEVAARTLHQASRRSQGPFMAINCGAIAPELIASELFGHEEGAYTGARRGGAVGKIAIAHGGTVLLDEIGEMPLDLQVALLRVLDSGEVVPVGAIQPTPVDVRFVCATHRDLPALVAAGRFREDLYYRLAAYVLTVPALRERTDFDAVLDALCMQLGSDPGRIGNALRSWLKDLPWPGNVRQLRHALRLSLALADDDEPLNESHFATLQAAPARPAVIGSPAGSLKATEQLAIEAALRQAHGNVTAAAKLLGIGRATLYRRLAK
ncbi:sigma-54-dependent Fis family transcriptional regulator [Azohydromonas australica]|uniref:sigma-54-dependent Fis family transcriptional regulator n=1 Tax=Azohydromonas australica TaxID=364039 RepID=UPI000428BE0C|nr:sigma-54-dependent Fis family transcriptional regulator [Azohydromonas australica]